MSEPATNWNKPFHLQTENITNAAAALSAGELIDRLDGTSTDEVKKLILRLELAQKTLRAIIRQRENASRRDAVLTATEQAATGTQAAAHSVAAAPSRRKLAAE